MSKSHMDVNMLLLEAMIAPNLTKLERTERILDATSALYEEAEVENILAQGTIALIKNATSLDEVKALIEKFDENLKTAQDYPDEVADIMKRSIDAITAGAVI